MVTNSVKFLFNIKNELQVQETEIVLTIATENVN